MVDVYKIIAELTEERTRLNEAIVSLELVAAGQKRRRGRPPTWLIDIQKILPGGTTGVKRRGRPPGSKNKPQ
jgi:hypothetical protein